MSLTGVIVVDLSENIAGPFCTQILADLGADVIKVERPGGDPARQWGPPFWNGEAVMFLAHNRNKRSVCLDLKDERDHAALLRLVAKADVVVTAMRPGAAARLEVDYDSLTAAKPDIVLCEITGYGNKGPEAGRGGYDALLQAEVGLMRLTGHEDINRPTRVGTSINDMGAGLWAVIGILAGLRKRDQTGEGCHVHTSLLQTAASWVGWQFMFYKATGAVPKPFGSSLPNAAPYEAHQARDGDLLVAAGTDQQFGLLVSALERPELASDRRFVTNSARVENRPALCAELDEVIGKLSVAEILARLKKAGVPCAPVQHVDSLDGHEQLEALGAFGFLTGLAGDTLPVVRSAVDIDHSEWSGARVPSLGEHTDEVLTWASDPVKEKKQ